MHRTEGAQHGCTSQLQDGLVYSLKGIFSVWKFTAFARYSLRLWAHSMAADSASPRIRRPQTRGVLRFIGNILKYEGLRAHSMTAQAHMSDGRPSYLTPNVHCSTSGAMYSTVPLAASRAPHPSGNWHYINRYIYEVKYCIICIYCKYMCI